MSWFYLALLAPFLYAIANLLDDNLLSFVYKTPYLACVSAGLYGVLPLLSLIFIHTSAIPFRYAFLAMLTGLLTLGYYFFYFKGLQSDTPSVVVALFSLAPATIPFLAHFVVHEQLVLPEIIGFVIVLLASLGLSVTDLGKLKFSKALVFVLIGVLIMDIMSITSKYVYNHVDFYPAYLYFSAGMGIGGVIFFLLKFKENTASIKQISKRIKRLLSVFLLAEASGLAAEFILNLAISRGPVSLVKVIEASQPMFVLLLALGLYPFAPQYFREAGEGHLIRKFVFMGIIVLGLLLVSLTVRSAA
jgi:drug/metabolite transporter (DMT)-like permease